ncbi:Ser/Thr protein kinase [Legionella gratiana]|uniref:Ser/Thr protein kinase n=1 Tax=Legionella gratiana TaxID=45066 RepID=A0A378JEQ5_9GAMM|nr:protein kinase [Legionella gratiana]KTD06555.1 Ser/Thr protein kinase [Legionella gratiana]STX45377.1 Ser/Thr protein kinase [Legionella gratiana]
MLDGNINEIINELQEQNLLPHAGKIIGGSRNQFDKEGQEKQGYLFSVIEEKLIGKGGFASVYPTTLYRQDETGVAKKSNRHKRFVTKEFNLEELKKNYSDLNIENLIEKEFDFCRKAGHLSIKPPVYDNNKCYLTMKRMPGKNLEKVFIKLMDSSNYLTQSQKIKLTYALLLALKTQVIDKGIIHRDIKPENIHVKIDEPMAVNIFDYGLAKKAGEEDNLFPGSPLWAAPELFTNLPHDNKADIFSMGRIIAFLWGQSTESYLSGSPFYNSKHAAKKLKLPENAKWVEPFLKQMLAQMQADRIDIDSAIKQFTQLVSINVPMLQLAQHPIDHHSNTTNLLFFQNPIENEKISYSKQLNIQRDIKEDLKDLLKYLPSQYSNYRNNTIFKKTVGRFTKIQQMMNELKRIMNEKESQDIPHALNDFINQHQNKLLNVSEANIIRKIKVFLEDIEYENLGYYL